MPGLDDQVIRWGADVGEDDFGEVDGETGAGRRCLGAIRGNDGVAGDLGVTRPGVVLGDVLGRVL